ALTAALLDEKVDGHLGRVVRVGVLQKAERAVAEDDADDRLAVAGARDAAERAVGVGAAADQCAVADTPRELAGSAAGRRGGGDRVRHDTGESRNGPALQAVSLHDRGVRLDRAVAREDRAAARVEAWIVLEGAYGGLDRVERGAAGRQHPPSRQRGRANALAK